MFAVKGFQMLGRVSIPSKYVTFGVHVLAWNELHCNNHPMYELGAPIWVASLCLRTENRSRKTHVFEYRDCGVEWGGVGGHVNVPCTSYMIYCHAAEISGIVYYVTCCCAADGVGWGGVGGHVNVPCTSCMIYCHAAEISGIVYYVTCADGGVGWGVMLTFLVLRTWYIAMLLGSLGLFTTLHVATLLRSLGSSTTLHVATLLRSLGSFTTLHAATLLRSLGSFTTLHVLCGIWWKSQFPATCVPKVTSWWCMLELGNGDAFARMLTASW